MKMDSDIIRLSGVLLRKQFQKSIPAFLVIIPVLALLAYVKTNRQDYSRVSLLALTNERELKAAGRDQSELATVSFSGAQSAELFSREVNESAKGAIAHNLIPVETAQFPKGFVRASLPGHPWEEACWTRDAGGFLRELALWGDTRSAELVSAYLRTHVQLNEEGYYTFPRYFTSKFLKAEAGEPGQGYEMDGTAAIIIGMSRLWQRLTEGDEKSELKKFLFDAHSPVWYIVRELKKYPFIAGTGEFGSGWGVKGKSYNVVQSGLLRQALLVSAELADESNDHAGAASLRAESDKLMNNISKYMIDKKDSSWIWCLNPARMMPEDSVLNFKLVKGTASINGASSCYADAEGLEPVADGWPGHEPARITLQKIYHSYPFRKDQFDKYGMCTFVSYDKNEPVPSNASWLSYCDCFAAQTMILLDQKKLLDKIMTWIAASTYMSGSPTAEFINQLAAGKASVNFKLPDSTFWFSERNFSPEFKGTRVIGCGKLNLVNVAEPMKLARLMVGIDDRYMDTVKIIPRLPDSWTGMQVNNWLLKTKKGLVRIDMKFEKFADQKSQLVLTVKNGDFIPNIVIKFPNAVSKNFRMVKGVLKVQST